MLTLSGSREFDQLREAFMADPSLRTELEWAFRLAVETYNPSDRGLRFITGAIGEWIVTLAAYRAGIVTLPDGHNADGHDLTALRSDIKALWSIKTSYNRGGQFTISNGQGGPGAGFVVPTVFLSPEFPGIVYVSPREHTEVVGQLRYYADSTKLDKSVILEFANRTEYCVIPFRMPENPGAAIRDPALEAVRLLVDNLNFPRLRTMFADVQARTNPSLIAQLKDLAALRDRGLLTETQYQAAVDRLTSPDH